MKKFNLHKLCFFAIIVCFLISKQVLFAGQNLDSLYQKFTSGRLSGQLLHRVQDGHITEKCGMSTVMHVSLNLKSFKVDQQAILKNLLSRTPLNSSIISPSGKFTIHFDSSGSNAPSYSMDSLAIALDSVYNFEVNYLGFPAPPINKDVDSDLRYHVYVKNLGNIYGQTIPENEVTTGSHTYYTYLEIDNSLDFYTKGIEAARVTAAHEFHHAIQLGNYYVLDLEGAMPDQFFYELTSTSMEEFVYNSVNDYYDYLDSYFRTPENSFPSHSGYDLVLWNLFLKEKFGFPIIKTQWELLNLRHRAMEAIYLSILDNGSSYCKEFGEFAKWCYYTGYRALPNHYFSEAKNYPMYRFLSTSNFSLLPLNWNFGTAPCSHAITCFVNSGTNDSIVIISTNADVPAAIHNPDSVCGFSLTLSSTNGSGYQQISKDYYSYLTTDNKATWYANNILNNSDATQSGFSYSVPYPNPFHTKLHAFGMVFLPLDKSDDSPEAELYIYDSAMHLIFHQNKNTINSNQRYVIWKPLAETNTFLGSGVYIYHISSKKTHVSGKVTVIND